MKPSKLIFLAMSVAMIAVAMTDHTKGIFVPSFKESFNIDDVGIGYILFLSSLAYVGGSFISGRFIEKYYQKKTMIIASVMQIIGLLLLVFMSDKISFAIGIILTNFSIASISLSINTTVSLLNIKRRALMMNFVHFLYGIGATLTQKFAGILLFEGFTFRNIYFIVMIFYSFLLFLSYFAGFANSEIKPNIPIISDGIKDEFTKKELDKDIPEKKANSKRKRFNAYEIRLLVIISLALGMYAGAELQTGNWLYSYIVTSFKMNSSEATNYTAAFFGLFTFGRLIGGIVAEKIGYLKSIIISMLIGSIFYISGLFIGVNGLVIISISGLFFSIVYPTVMVVIRDVFDNNYVVATGIVIAVASGVNMFFNPLIGAVSKYFGIEIAMFFLPVFLFLSSLLMMYVFKTTNKECEEQYEIIWFSPFFKY